MASDQTVERPRPELSAAKRALIEARLRGQVRSSGIVPRAHRDGAPLSFAQERLWFIDRLEPGSAVYNVPVAWRLGALDEAALERALGEIVRRHEALRTTFREVDGTPVQVISPFGGFTLPVDDLSGLADADREVEVRRRAGEEAMRPFDLTAGPLFRAALLRLGEESHVLLLSIHHIVSDGWSMGVFFRELSALYTAYREGRESPLPELPVQYADYAVWQREHLRGEMLERQLSYWRERLAGAPELLELPTDHPRPAVQTFRGAIEGIELPGELLERLRALGRSEGATLYMVLLGVFQVLLSKYGGSEDVVVGSPVAGRTRDEVAGLIGFFVNTLVLRTGLGGDPSFREVLRRVREVTLGAYEHQELPFEKLVAELQPERSLSHSPLFQVSFSLDDVEESGSGEAESGTEGVDTDFAFAKFDLTLGLVATRRGLLGELNYGTDLFERGTIVRMLGHLGRVLEQVAANADVRLSELELLGEAERALVLEGWNRTAAEVPADRCIHELFEAQAARTPGAAAVRFEEESLTYGELNERANRLAHHLRGCGVGPEVRVGVLMERSLEMVVSLLAVLKAGGAYVPLDPGLPADRLAYMLDDSAVPLVLVQAALRGDVPAREGVEVLAVDALAERLAAEPAENPAGGAGPDSLAYVIYTSGSTGRPKGVMNAHRGVVNRLVWMQAQFGIGADDVVLQKTPFGFDVSVWELFWPLQQGACLVMARPDGHRDPLYLQEVIERRGVTTLHFVPSMLQQFVETADPARCGSLLRVVCSGEALPPALVERFYDRFAGPVVLTNLYGPTEAAVDVSCWTCPREEAADVVPIGRPVWNTALYVLDIGLRPVPVGTPGELYIGGVQVARGYQDRSAMTAERFVPDPFSVQGGARLYRTGDRARWRTDGAIEYLGRLDFQVKVRGFRIELGEIEAALRGHESVADCVVMARAEAGEQRLVAYVVGDIETDTLRSHVRRSLPEYMVPSAFVFLDALPLTANGKLDRKALPAPELGSAEERYVAPRTPVEEVLAGIWAEVLRLERVGVEESFFDLGGHSLLATRVVSRVRELLGVELPLRVLFEGPTVAELAGRVEEMRRAGLPVLPPVVPVERTGALPLSFAQERLWFIDRLEPGSAVYNVPMAWRLAGALDEAALERALGEIVRRHESLRTVFGEVDGSPVQVVAPFGGFALPVEDLSGLSEEDREAAVEQRAGEEARRVFDLAAGPLFRAALLRLDAEDHVLLVGMHHIVSDGWSLGVLSREFSVLYAAYREGRESPLRELPVQYADYAVWQREQLAGEALERQLAYWRERLAGAPELLELPTDRPRPAVQTYRGATVPVELSPELLERLRALGQSEGATLYMTLLGAFQVLLSRYGGGEDIVVGSPIAGRTRGEVEALIGFFVNTLVLRTDLGGDPSFRETMRRVREVTLGAYEHQEVPFEKLVEELQPERSLSHSPLFQVMFTLQNAGSGGGALPGLSVSGVGGEDASAKFDLSLSLVATPQGLRGGLNYGTDLFEPGTIERMVRHLGRVLEQVAADADTRLSQLELLDEAERAFVLEAWNRTDAEYPADRCIHELFEAQAARAPGAVAVRFEEESLTYRELNERANRLAHSLRRCGVGPEVRVGICLERSLEMVVGILAILKAGGAYVPLDPGYPAERLAFILADSATPVLLTREVLRGALPAREGVEVVSLDGAAEEIAAESAENPESGAGPDSLAYVIYTSGSTGAPKGALIEHRNVARLFSATDAWFGFGPDDVWTLFHSYAFDFSVWELWGALLYGGRVVVVPFDVSRDPEAFHALVQREGVTVLNQTPSAFRQFIRVDGERGGDLALRVVVFGGEALEPASLREWVERRGIETPRLVNMYGITETTVHVTYRPLSREDVISGSGSPIGQGIPDLRLYVLDPARRPVPIGVPGELYVGGAGVARGYLNRPELTAERFVDDPFAPGRLYRTGDRVRWLADGTLEYLGRLDEQVKIRGFRIELGEIEAALRQAPGVADCTVLAREDETGDRRLVAYVVGAVEADALRAHLRQSLPEYMVPGAFVVLDRLPLTANGKVDRKALPAPELASAEDRYVAPRTPVEEVLAGIWAEVLRLERVGVEESFFELGGHSLLATRVVSRVRELFGVDLPLRALFEGPTVAEMAVRVEEMRRAGLPVLPAVVPVERTGALPLSFAQERLWFIDRLEPGSAAYNIPVAWRLGGALDEAALERSLSEIVRRHEALRTTFAEVDGSPVQVVAPFGGLTLPVEDLSGLSGEDREAAVEQRAEEEARRVFDLAAGPLFRAALLRLDAEDHVLLLSMHHIVSDGWSMGVLSREFSVLYAAYREGRESPLRELPVQYADYAVWQREQLEGEVLDRQLSYWRDRLSGAPELLELPTDRPRPAVQTYQGATVPVELSPELLERLRALARSEGATLYMVGLGAFQVLLSKYGGGEDIVVGSPIAGRTRGEVEALIGFFVNTLVLRTDLGGDPGFRAVLGRVREATLGAYEHQEVPFEKLVAELQPVRSLGHSPLFQVMFSFDHASGAGSVLPGLATKPVGAEMETAKFDLSLGLVEGPGGGWGSLSYSTDLFEPETIERMVRHLERVLEQVAAEPDVRLSELDLLDGTERRQVVEVWNATRAPHPAGLCTHQLVEAQVERTPHAAAVVFRGETLTYRELNERANRLARHLRRLGVGPEARVAVCLERGPEMVVSVLATLKAGGAYVPLDPAYPAERLAFMLADSAAAVLLTGEGLRGALPVRAGTEVLSVEPAEAELAGESGENLESGAQPGSLAYVIYTSGSTGTPKGVAVEHRALVGYLAHAVAEYAIRAGDRFLQFASISFDPAAEEIFATLVSGATLVLRTEEMLETPGSFWEACDRWGVSLLGLPTAVWHNVSPHLDARPEALPESLRLVVIGGEAALPEQVRAWQAATGGRVRLLNSYGPTETTIGVTLWEAPESGVVSRVPIGRPVPNTRCYVLDAAMRPAAAGVPGELYVGGAQVARGYLDRPAATAERFVPDPFAAEPGARLYRTGDRVRWRGDGTLEYLGRLDAQVKVRGFRIELGEIEGALRRSEGVADCVVVAREDVPGEKRLVAYVVGDAEAGVLREHLLRELPEYMVPAAFVPLERLPLTPNGKLDRKALPVPEGDAYARRSYEAPLGEVETALAEIWAEMLGAGRVGRWDHYFELGGHSLLAIKLIERMRRAGLYMEVRALFTTPVLAELALAVGRASLEVEVPANGIPEGCGSITPEMLPLVELSQAEIDRIVAEVPGGAANVQDIYPLAPLQEGIHFHHLLSQEGDPYLLPSVSVFDTRARLERYLEALQAVIDRHDILRTALAWEGLSEPVQVVWRHAPLPLEEVELDPAAGDVAGQLWRRYDARQYRMELGRAPLLRACITEDRARGRWLLLLLTHHLTGDHESVEVLREEISAHLLGLEAELPAPLPFRGYVAQARLGVSREEHERFFRGLLGDVEEPTAPYGMLDVWGEGHGIGEAWLPVAGDVGARLRRRARALGVSAASLCHLAWAQVLARLSGRADVVFGTLLFGRMQGGEGADRVMGPFINTLPVRIGVGEEGVEAAVRRTHALLADLLRHEHASLSLAQRSSGVAPPAPLFTSLLNYRYSGRTSRSQEAGQPGEGVRDLHAEERTNYPVVLTVDDLGEEFSLVAQVAAPAEAERVCRMMHTALERLVEALEVSPGRAMGSIDVLSEEERRQVVEEWNRTERPYPRGVCVHELFEAQVRERPGAMALAWGEETLTYRELDARANQLANHLVRLGVGPDARVGVLLERSAELIVSILAVLKAGGAYVPLDPGYPPERLRLMLADSSVRVLLSRTELAEVVEAGDLAVVHLDQAADALASESVEAPLGGATAENLAYIVYTSGSTGKPKGVMVAHRHVVQLVVETDYVRFRPGDRIAQASNASFDALTFEAWGAFLNGATLVGIPRDVLLSPPALHRMLREERITTLYQTTALLNQLSREQPDVFAPLREVLFGGQAVDADSVRRLLKAGGPERLLHMYGPTETTAWCSWEQVEQVAEDALTVSVGRATGNQRIYLLDSALSPVPVEVPGEAYVGGDGVVRGYLDRPGLTAERFLPDPFAAEPGARMYRSGDRLRWKADGKLEFIGRVDEQVKIRGYRIEPGEIEAVLSAHAEVREARVIVGVDASGEQRLVAYVVGSVEADELREHLRESLPEYMVPAAFVGLEALPLTPNGKLDVRALPAPELGSAEGQSVAPGTPVEEVLAGIWSEVLRLEQVGVHDNFFELGGHSLLAIRVVSRIREVFTVELPLRALFEGPTIAEVAGRVEEMRRAGLPLLAPVVPVERAGALPLSFAQERLWFIDRLEPGSVVYNIPATLRLTGALDEAALERSLSEIVRRHEVLRTTFAEVGGTPVQVIAPFGGFALPVEDLSGLDEADREAAVGRRADEEERQPFDLSADPLFRAALLRLGAEDHVLLLSMHHVVSDGWSMGVFYRELSALYAAYREGRTSPLPELAVQYADYAVWQRGQLAGEVLDRQLSYWRERLAGAPELLELPTDRPRPPVQTYRGASVPMELSLELLERLRALGRGEGATLYMTLLGAFQVLLSKYAGSEDVVVGSPIAGRTRGEVDALIGFFVNTLVLRTDLSGDPSFREVLRQVREATLGAYEHEEVPFEKLVAELQPERSLSHSPLFQVMFTVQNADARGGGGGFAGLEVSGVGATMEIAKYDLSLTLAAAPRGLLGALNYNTDLFERGTIERMLGHLARVLEQVAADADVRLSRLALTGPEERARVVVEWNRTERPYPRGVCVHELFEAQVRERPGAAALAWGEESLTYRELDARANQLANHLVRLGVGPDARVGVLLERSAELIVSILAVLKAGGAYVPLDPGYPPERLRLMLSDSDARVLLSRSERAGVVEAGGLAVVHLDQAADALASESVEAPLGGATAENLAYIVYTSGSTGKPKGVMVAHRHVVQLVCETDYVRIRPGDRVAQASNASFDALTFEAWGALMNGATLVGIPRDVLLSPAAFRETLREERITTLYQTTALLNQLSREQPDVFSTLREVLFGGQAADADSVRRLLKAGGPERLLHMYGPTETTAWCSWEQVEQVAEDALTVSVGRATGNQRIYLLDAALNPVPVGVPGEAYVGGDGVVRGYLERPGLTAERFVPDPFAVEPGARMYRTGDRLRWRADGRLEFIGRVDEQVKVRGFRIEPGEIEAVLSAHAEVREARVIVGVDASGEKRLVAYVVGGVEADELRQHLRESLPEYMVPAAFVGLEQLPLTPNGKLDVRALPAPELASAEERYVAPRTPVEEVLAGIWAEVLRLERVGVHDNFFELGGHSLLIMRLLADIHATFDQEISIRTVFSMPTLEAMAGEIERRIYEEVATMSEFEVEQLAESNPVAGA